MDDLISRQAAIDAIEHRLAEPAYQHTGEDWYVGMNCAESELYFLPSAQPAQRWIPVTERLPERRQVVIAIGEKGTWDVGMFFGLAFGNLDPSEWNWKKNTVKTVKWWMKKEDALPEPPKEEP